MVKKNYNLGIALGKMLMCFVVVQAHFWDKSGPPSVLTIISSLQTFAVPFFMVISFFLSEMEQIENGTALIAMRSKSPVVPVYFREKLRFFHVTHIYVGDPIAYDDLLAEGINTETCEKMNERMRETYRRMIAETGGSAE
jgi:hypothetical protein